MISSRHNSVAVVNARKGVAAEALVMHQLAVLGTKLIKARRHDAVAAAALQELACCGLKRDNPVHARTTLSAPNATFTKQLAW